MAQVLQVTDGTTTVDLLAGNFKLTADGWRTTTSKEKVWEEVEIITEATDANVRTTKDQLDELAEQARRYHLNSKYADGVWFQWASEGETTKQSLVYSIESEIMAHESLSSPLLGISAAIIRVLIKRHPQYENTSATTTSTSNLSTLGGEWSIGNDAGTSPQRIQELRLAYSGSTLQQFWVGIRPLYEGVGSFVALWEAESGSAGSGVTAPADGTASGGNKLLCDLTQTANDGLKTEITIGNIVGSNYNHFIGKYHILCRMKVASSATQVMIELKQYWQGSYSSAGLTFIDGETTWTLFSLGTISLPPSGDRDNVASSHADFDDCGFSIYANSVDDTGTLDIDCYVLIPAEHTLTILGGEVSVSNTTLSIFTDPDELIWGLGTSTQAQGGLQISPEGWEYPLGGGHLVIAAQADSGHTLATDIDITNLALYPRWKTFRV
jgi:hypothetical protein